MKIRKVEPSVGILGKILNLFSNSKKDTYSCDYLNNNDTYSTDEIKTNKRWINGKPIYQKTILVSSLPASADIVAYNHNVNNMELGWFDLSNCFIEFKLSQENHFTVPLPCNNYTGASIFLFNLDASSFKIKTTQDRSNLKAYVTIRYIKTTD